MKIRITKILSTSSHFGNGYNLVGCVGEVDEISKTVIYDKTSEYYGMQVDFISIYNCKYMNPSDELTDGGWTTIFGAEFEIVEE